MRVKIGDTWYSPKVGVPIMIQLTDEDRENLANMPEGMDRYGCWHDGDPMSVEDSRAWMDEGYTPNPPPPSESRWEFELMRDDEGRVLLGDGTTMLSKELSDKLDKGELKFEPVFLDGRLIEFSLVPNRNHDE